MPREQFEQELKLAATPETTWATVTDVPRLVQWISILEDAEVIEPLSRYRAVLADRLGMFQLRADLDIQVVDHAEASFLRATAEGEDRQVGSRLAVAVEMRLEPDDRGTRLWIDGSYEVTGRIATLGSSTIRRKADTVIRDFVSSLERELS